MLSRIDRLLLGRGLRAFLLIVGLVLVLVLGMHALLNYNQLTRGELAPDQSRPLLILQYYCYLAPSFIAPILTLSAMAAALLTCAPMLKKRELVSVTAAGLSLRRATLALLALAVFVGLFAVGVRDQIEPRLEGERAALSDRLTGRIRTGRIWQIPETGTRWYAQTVHLQDPTAPDLQRLIAATPDGSLVYAERLRWTGDHWQLAELVVDWHPEHGRSVVRERACVGELALHRGPDGLRQLLVSRFAMTGVDLLAEGDPISRAFAYRRLLAGLAPLLAMMLALAVFVRHENHDHLITAAIRALLAGCVPWALLAMGERSMETSALGPEITAALTALIAAAPAAWTYARWRL